MAALYEVVSGALNFREAPSATAPVISALEKGQIVEKVGDSDKAGWWKVRTAIGKVEEEGFVSKTYLVAVDPAPSKGGFRLFPFLPDLRASFQRVTSFVGPYAERFGPTALPELNTILRQYGINKNTKRFTHFMAQVAHESANFRLLEENLKYSAERLLVVFPKYFKTPEDAQAYALQPEKIANRIYASRMGNGDEASGDGWRYRGRGFIQLTGRENYRKIGAKIGEDLEANPDRVATELPVALKTACAYWDDRNLNALADADDIRAITKKINGGYHGLAERERLLAKARKIWT